MAAMATVTADGMESLPVAGTVEMEIQPDFGAPQRVFIDLRSRLDARIAHCRRFAGTMETLASLAEKELRQDPFTAADIKFIRSLMNSQDHEYTGPTYDGWYPDLFYKDYGQLLGNTDTAPCNQEDPLVTDIHTAPPDDVDPKGGVLHEATGNVDMLLIAVDNGPDRMVYAGPTLSHYEFMVEGPTLKRLADSEWKGMNQVGGANRPPRPEWTRDYLVPTP